MTIGTVLVVEDDAAIRRGIVDSLRFAGYGVLEAGDGAAGLKIALSATPDLVLLDVLMPKKDGFEVLGELRRSRPNLPVIMLTARGAEEDRVKGLRGGADDYVVKPFSTRELVLRIRAVVQRADGRTPGLALEGGKVQVGAAVVDFAAYTVTRGGERHGLSRRELELLRYLIEHDGETLDRQRLLNDVWGADEFPTTRTIDTHVLKLRKKVEADPEAPRHILTVHGVGYRFQRRADGGAPAR